jgi:hypothetical protein
MEEFRERMPVLRQREQGLRTELQAIADQPTIAQPSCAWRRPLRRSLPPALCC